MLMKKMVVMTQFLLLIKRKRHLLTSLEIEFAMVLYPHVRALTFMWLDLSLNEHRKSSKSKKVNMLNLFILL